MLTKYNSTSFPSPPSFLPLQEVSAAPHVVDAVVLVVVTGVVVVDLHLVVRPAGAVDREVDGEVRLSDCHFVHPQ